MTLSELLENTSDMQRTEVSVDEGAESVVGSASVLAWVLRGSVCSQNVIGIAASNNTLKVWVKKSE